MIDLTSEAREHLINAVRLKLGPGSYVIGVEHESPPSDKWRLIVSYFDRKKAFVHNMPPHILMRLEKHTQIADAMREAVDKAGYLEWPYKN